MIGFSPVTARLLRTCSTAFYAIISNHADQGFFFSFLYTYYVQHIASFVPHPLLKSLNPSPAEHGIPLANSVDPDQLASEEAN